MPDEVALFADDAFVELSVCADMMLEANRLFLFVLLIDVHASRRKICLEYRHIVELLVMWNHLGLG